MLIEAIRSEEAATHGPNSSERKVPVNFRWPIEQIGSFSIMLKVPEGPNGHHILNEGFIEANRLSDRDVNLSEEAVIRTIAVID